MSTMNISLPDEMRAWVESEVKGGGFSSASEFFRQLVREAKAQREKETFARKKAELEALLIEGLESESVVADANFWANLRAECNESLETKGAAR